MTTLWTSTRVLEEILFPLIEELEEEVGEDIARDPATPLLGEGSVVDSLALVSFLVTVEEQLELTTDRAIRLVDDRAMSKRESPFRTLGTLSDHISEML
jgi:acyl carrier protein